MEYKQNNDPFLGMSKHRIEGIYDAIFAIAMTIAVLDISVGELDVSLNDPLTLPVLSVVWPQFLHYAIAFLVMSLFWVGHTRRFHFIRHVDNNFVWLNMLSLLFVAVIPFTTILVGDFPSSFIAIFLFAADIFLIGTIDLLAWRYASKDRLLTTDDMDEKLAAYSMRKGAAMPVTALIVIAAAFITPEYATLLFVIIPIMYYYLRFRHLQDS